MDALRQFPLGAAWPDSPHAVVSCLPTMADVRGYEEKEPRVMAALQSGYPRFVRHRFVADLLEFYLERSGLTGVEAALVVGRRAAEDSRRLLSCLGGAGVSLQPDDAPVYLVHCPEENPAAPALRRFVQHTGCGISSRQAEDLLLKHGLRNDRFVEETCEGHALSQVEAELAVRMGCRQRDVLVCTSGMNAFYAGFRAVQDFQRTRNRHRWVQLGWLYLDSGKILQNFLEADEELDCLYDVSDVDRVIEQIRAAGDDLAAVVVECPSNPLIRSCDLARIAAAVREQGGVLMVDPTIASIYNVDVLPWTDLLVTSLTKYAAIEGDIMIGALAVNPDSPLYGDLVLRTSSFHTPAYGRDLARLAVEMTRAPAVIRKTNANAARLADFLEAHPAVKRVYRMEPAGSNAGIRRDAESGGSVLSIKLHGSMEKFYDQARIMKGPSFGTRFSLICPFMYLAHYDLVSSVEGRGFLNTVGIDPELIRIAVGEEPYEQIEAVFAEALAASLDGEGE